MSQLYNESAPKKPTNLTVNSDLLSQAKALDVNISAILESALVETLKQRKRDAWLLDNEEAMESYNKTVEQIGFFSEGRRTF